MNKFKTFLRTFKKSLTEPAYYKDILLAKFSFSFKYLFVLLLILSVVLGIKASFSAVKILPQIPGFVEESKKVLVDIYPNELKLTVKDKKIKTNVKEPYYIDYPKKEVAIGLPFKHLLAIDTKAKSDDFAKYESMFLLTEDSFVSIESGQSSFKVTPIEDAIKDIPNGATLDKKMYQSLIEKIYPFLDKLPDVAKTTVTLGLIAFPVIRAVLGIGGQMLILLPTALVFWLFAKMIKRNINYGKIYQMSMHGLTLPLLISTAVSLIGFYPWYSSLIIWIPFYIFMGMVVSKLDKVAVSK